MTVSDPWEFQSVPIDFEVFKALTALLNAPQDTYNNVLRRALGLESHQIAAQPESAGGKPWVIDGVTFPHGTEFRAKYKGQLHSGSVQDGMLVVRGQRYDSPSAAAMSITGNNVNGWKFWQSRRPGGITWMDISSLRRSEARAKV